MRLLGLSAVFMTTSAWQGLVLLALGRERLTVRYNLMALVLGLCLHALLISLLGAAGAALGSIAIGMFTTAAGLIEVHRVAGLRLDGGRIARLGATWATATAAFVGTSALGGGWALATLAGIAVYLLAVVATRIADPRVLVSAFAGRGAQLDTAGGVG